MSTYRKPREWVLHQPYTGRAVVHGPLIDNGDLVDVREVRPMDQLMVDDLKTMDEQSQYFWPEGQDAWNRLKARILKWGGQP